MKKLFKWVAIVFAVLIVIGIVMPNNQKAATSPASDGAQASSTEAAPGPAAMAVSARELFSDYEDNEVSADQKYKGKRLEVTGTVAGINKDAFDGIYVELATKNEFSSVHARGLPEQVAAGLNKGDSVKVSCEGAGMVIGSPMLDDCTML